MYRESNYQKVSLVNVEPQVGPNDCGLFCIAYARMLAYGRDPFKYKFNQTRMRQTFFFWITAIRLKVGKMYGGEKNCGENVSRPHILGTLIEQLLRNRRIGLNLVRCRLTMLSSLFAKIRIRISVVLCRRATKNRSRTSFLPTYWPYWSALNI
ncbi:hypothetical protein BpHYR1_015953 [Brachionus plicatilis]|uniref:Ubiquitin-like protease family profile domain-containing protein n=1 Tax=Brachionus plicatilis TaxID=10195 RepID=A0A3M7T0L1_BRAPC|nr:hypothetical protein BpHYR1_015953 [Brachionus plicatilis]